MEKIYTNTTITLLAVFLHFPSLLSMVQQQSQTDKAQRKKYLQWRKQLISRLPDRKNWHYITINNFSNKTIQITYYRPCPGFEGPGVIKRRKVQLKPNQTIGNMLLYRKYKVVASEENGQQKLAFTVHKIDDLIHIKEQNDTFILEKITLE